MVADFQRKGGGVKTFLINLAGHEEKQSEQKKNKKPTMRLKGLVTKE